MNENQPPARTHDELLTEADTWFEKLYRPECPIYRQITARRPGDSSAEGNLTGALDRIEAHGKERLKDFDRAVRHLSK